MKSKLEEVFSNNTGEDGNDALYQAMSQLLIILLQRLNTQEKDDLVSELSDRNKYPRYSSLANKLIPKPM